MPWICSTLFTDLTQQLELAAASSTALTLLYSLKLVALMVVFHEVCSAFSRLPLDDAGRICCKQGGRQGGREGQGSQEEAGLHAGQSLLCLRKAWPCDAHVQSCHLCCIAVKLCCALHMHNDVTSAVLLSGSAMHCTRTMVSQLACMQVSASSKASSLVGSRVCSTHTHSLF